MRGCSPSVARGTSVTVLLGCSNAATAHAMVELTTVSPGPQPPIRNRVRVRLYPDRSGLVEPAEVSVGFGDRVTSRLSLRCRLAVAAEIVLFWGWELG
jgi:hypothetical protein